MKPDFDMDKRKIFKFLAFVIGSAAAIWAVSFLCTSLVIYIFLK